MLSAARIDLAALLVQLAAAYVFGAHATSKVLAFSKSGLWRSPYIQCSPQLIVVFAFGALHATGSR